MAVGGSQGLRKLRPQSGSFLLPGRRKLQGIYLTRSKPAIPALVPQPGPGSGRSLGMTAGETHSRELRCAVPGAFAPVSAHLPQPGSRGLQFLHPLWPLLQPHRNLQFCPHGLCGAPWPPLPGLIFTLKLCSNPERVASPCLILFPCLFPSEAGSHQAAAGPLVHHSATQCSLGVRMGYALLKPMFLRSWPLASSTPSVWQVTALYLTPFVDLSSFSSSRASLVGSGAALTLHSLSEVAVVRSQMLSTACLPSVAPPPPRAASCSGLTRIGGRGH